VRSLTIARGTGGRGARKGGDGLVKELQPAVPVTATFLAERHRLRPAGSAGGGAGRPGELALLRGGRRRRLPAKTTVSLEPGDVLCVRTPGGGGHGR
jgi:N-methylhydantoinase B